MPVSHCIWLGFNSHPALGAQGALKGNRNSERRGRKYKQAFARGTSVLAWLNLSRTWSLITVSAK